MRVAIRTGSTFGHALVDKDGKLTGEHSGLAIVRRLLKLWPDPILVGHDGMSEAPWECDGFTVVHPARLDVNDTVIVNMDVVDSMQLYRELRRGTWRLHPRILNLVWWNTSEWTDKIERQELALSTALFPTFCNSKRTEIEIRSLIGRHLLPSALSAAQIQYENLGIPQPDVELADRLERPRVVMYPAMWLFDRKRPERFLDIVGAVAQRIPLKAVMRLHDKELHGAKLREWPEMPWLNVEPLASKELYWDNLGKASVFVATASDESYGLQYLEALWAGQIGLFPRRPWAENILPPGYPFLYETVEQAQTMLYYVLANWWDAREAMTTAFGDDGVRAWLRSYHAEEDFDSELVLFAEQQYPELAEEMNGEG